MNTPNIAVSDDVDFLSLPDELIVSITERLDARTLGRLSVTWARLLELSSAALVRKLVEHDRENSELVDQIRFVEMLFNRPRPPGRLPRRRHRNVSQIESHD